jgi:hypothetical protein
MCPPTDPIDLPGHSKDAYEDFWAVVDAELIDDSPPVIPHGPDSASDPYAEFSDLSET